MDPFTWAKAREELKRRRERAYQMGGPQAVERQHQRGRQAIRERIAQLTDPGTFYEIGTLATHKRYDGEGNPLPDTASSYVMGLAKIDGRSVAVGGEDFTVEGGAVETGHARLKGGGGGFVEDLALEYKIPLILPMEGVGGGVGREEKEGFAPLVSSTDFHTTYQLLGQVPVLVAAMGACAGVAAARLMACHFSVMLRDQACVFAGGPPIVERALGHRIDKFQLGGWQVHAQASGCIDNVAEDEADAFHQLKRVLSYLPQNVWEMPPYVPTDDPIDRQDDVLLQVVPEDRRRAYDVHDVIEVIVDRDSWFEIGPHWGKALATGFARFGGYVVGVVGNNPMHVGGALDAAASEKQARFVDFCDLFHIPLLYLVDVPGFMIGEAAEREGTLRKGMRALQSVMQATVPMVSIYMHKAYGMAAVATANAHSLMLRAAWPTAEWGDMPIEGGVAAAWKRVIEQAEDPDQKRAEIEARLREAASPWKTAEHFGVEEMIDPVETRELVCRFIEAAQGSIRARLGPKPRYGLRL